MQSMNTQVNNEFLTDANAQMIWDIMQESRIYNNVEYQDQIEIRKHFIQNMRLFYEQKGRGIPHLFEQNKLFIGAVLNEYRSKERPNASIKPQKKEAYTTKEIQAERASQFERDLDKRRNDFENSIAVPKPPVPEFSDKMDKPISEMNALIAKTVAQRELEIAQIHQGLTRSSQLQTPMETSVRHEKQMFKQINISNEEPPRNLIQATELSPPPTSASNFNKKVTVDESQNRIHLFVEDIGAQANGVEEDNGFMSKFKVTTNPSLESGPTSRPVAVSKSDAKSDGDGNADGDVYQELRQVQRKQQQQYQQLLLKMDELSEKMDFIAQLVRERSS